MSNAKIIDVTTQTITRDVMSRLHAARADDDLLIALAADRDSWAAESTVLASLLKRADEELRLIRMKDHPGVYDVTLRMETDIALRAREAIGE